MSLFLVIFTVVIVNVKTLLSVTIYSYYVSVYRYLLTLYCARPPFPQLKRCGLILMQKLASTLDQRLMTKNKNVLVCAGVLASYTVTF